MDGEKTFENATIVSPAESWNELTPPKRSHYELAVVGAVGEGAMAVELAERRLEEVART